MKAGDVQATVQRTHTLDTSPFDMEMYMGMIALACASHSSDILAANLARSPAIRDRTLELHVERNSVSAAVAYNAALDTVTAPIVVFVHHDVYLPQGWERILEVRLAELPDDWALFGSFGVGHDGTSFGPVWSSSLGAIVGQVPMEPAPVQSFDEMLIVLRRDSGVRFDPALPGWHMYGTDIAQTALAAGRGAYAGALPCIHNDKTHGKLDGGFDTAYRFMQRKWRSKLPINTPITKISRSGLHFWRDRFHSRRSEEYFSNVSVGTDHPVEELAARCGWSVLTQ